MAAVLKTQRDVIYREIEDFKIATQTHMINGSVKIIAKAHNKKSNISLHFLAFVKCTKKVKFILTLKSGRSFAMAV
jgi:hypothetical protein